jgi:hypothetical protein
VGDQEERGAEQERGGEESEEGPDVEKLGEVDGGDVIGFVSWSDG